MKKHFFDNVIHDKWFVSDKKMKSDFKGLSKKERMKHEIAFVGFFFLFARRDGEIFFLNQIFK